MYLRLDVIHANEESSYSLHTNFGCPYIRQQFNMSLVLKPILKLLSRSVVYAPSEGTDINIYAALVAAAQVYSSVEIFQITFFLLLLIRTSVRL